MIKFQKGYYADVRIEERFNTEVSYRNGMLEESKQSLQKKAFLRVYDGKMWYYASVYDLNHLQEELDKLYQNATYCKDIENDPQVRLFEVNQDRVLRFEKDCVKDVSIEKKHKILTDAYEILKQSSELKMCICLYLDRYSKYEFYSSKGANILYDYQMCGACFSVAAANERENCRNFIQKCDNSFDKITLTDAFIKDFVDETVDFLNNAKSIEPCVAPVILSPEVAGVFAHESFGHKSEADFMIGDETMKKEWTLGKKVGSDILSIYDSGLENGSGYVPYDDEGTKARKNYLIKNGVLCGRLHSAATAADLGEGLTGNARAINCDYEPIVRMTSTIIEGGKLSKEQLFAGIKHGYFIKSYQHGSGMSTFTIAPLLAYEIVDGKIAGPVKIAVITGNVFETLSLIDGVSNDVTICSSVTGGCGKMEQFPLNVADGGPYVRISKMNIQ
jgi:TldD protein